jgi:transposase
MFPPLRAKWALKGRQAVVEITGYNARRTLFGTINIRTGERILMRRWKARQADFQDFLKLLRETHGRRPVVLIVDRSPIHEAGKSQKLAAELGITMLWLPKQCSELNGMDQLWKELKRMMAANRQFQTIDDQAQHCANWILGLTTEQACRKASILSEDFWLRLFCKDFCKPT